MEGTVVLKVNLAKRAGSIKGVIWVLFLLLFLILLSICHHPMLAFQPLAAASDLWPPLAAGGIPEMQGTCDCMVLPQPHGCRRADPETCRTRQACKIAHARQEVAGLSTREQQGWGRARFGRPQVN